MMIDFVRAGFLGTFMGRNRSGFPSCGWSGVLGRYNVGDSQSFRYDRFILSDEVYGVRFDWDVEGRVEAVTGRCVRFAKDDRE
jgi:hypothetical protein